MIRVSLPWATFGLVVSRDDEPVILEAAPIASWCEGKPAREVWDYWRRRGAHLLWMGWTS